MQFIWLTADETENEWTVCLRLETQREKRDIMAPWSEKQTLPLQTVFLEKREMSKQRVKVTHVNYRIIALLSEFRGERILEFFQWKISADAATRAVGISFTASEKGQHCYGFNERKSLNDSYCFHTSSIWRSN